MGRFAVTVQAIAPKKTEPGKALPLPRIVSYNNSTKTGLGVLSLSQAKKVLQGSRGAPGSWLTVPIFDEDGGNVHGRRLASDMLSDMASYFWQPKNIQMAGPPDSATY